jgi:hypothetical protein
VYYKFLYSLQGTGLSVVCTPLNISISIIIPNHAQRFLSIRDSLE